MFWLAYFVSMVLCFILSNLASKVHDREILVKDVVFASICAIVPVWNSFMVLVAIFFTLKGTVENYGHKRLF